MGARAAQHGGINEQVTGLALNSAVPTWRDYLFCNAAALDLLQTFQVSPIGDPFEVHAVLTATFNFTWDSRPQQTFRLPQGFETRLRQLAEAKHVPDGVSSRAGTGPRRGRPTSD